MATSFARRERTALCDLALALGPDAPTRCTGWSVRDLLAHLLVREHHPLAASGIAVPAFSGATERAMAEESGAPFAQMVERLRTPALLLRVPGADTLLSAVELFVHHEDLRRATDDWHPRPLDAAASRLLWRFARAGGRVLVRPAGVPVRLVRADTGASATVRRGEDPVVVTGLPAELVLMLFDRPAHGLQYAGPAGRVAALRSADLGA